MKKNKYGISNRLQQLSRPQKSQIVKREDAPLTQEEIEEKEEKKRQNEERRLKYKKFDFESFLSRGEGGMPNDHPPSSKRSGTATS